MIANPSRGVSGHTHRVEVDLSEGPDTANLPCADPGNCPMTDGKMEQFRSDRDAAIADTVKLRSDLAEARAEVVKLKTLLDHLSDPEKHDKTYCHAQYMARQALKPAQIRGMAEAMGSALAPAPERFSIGWRFRIDQEYQRGALSEERWRDLVAAFEEHSATTDALEETKRRRGEVIILHKETHQLRSELERTRTSLSDIVGWLEMDHQGPHYRDPLVPCAGPGVCQTLVDLEVARGILEAKPGGGGR